MQDTQEATRPAWQTTPTQERTLTHWMDACHGEAASRQACAVGAHIGVVAGGLCPGDGGPPSVMCLIGAADGGAARAPQDLYGWRAVTGEASVFDAGDPVPGIGWQAVWCLSSALADGRVRADDGPAVASMMAHMLPAGSVLALIADPPEPGSDVFRWLLGMTANRISVVCTVAWRMAGLSGEGVYVALPVVLAGTALQRAVDWEHTADSHTMGAVVRHGDPYDQRRDAVLTCAALVAEHDARHRRGTGGRTVTPESLLRRVRLSDRRHLMGAFGYPVAYDIPTLACCDPDPTVRETDPATRRRRESRAGLMTGSAGTGDADTPHVVDGRAA